MPDSERTMRGVRTALSHDSAARHVSGQALYTDDLPEPQGLLHLHIGTSAKANARIVSMDLDAVRRAPGVVLVLTAADIPGKNDVSPHAGDDPVFAMGEALYAGQSLFAVAAETRELARAAASLAKIVYEERLPLVTVAQARAAGAEIEPEQMIERGDADAALAAAPHRMQGSFALGGQDHFYLEGQVSMAWPQEGGGVLVHCSTQHPTEVQHLVSGVLARPYATVTVEVRRMGGGFGGKESQPALFAAIAALAAAKTGRPAKARPDRDDDMIITGKRHDFEIGYDVGFDAAGRILGTTFDLASRCGYSVDLSPAINDRAMLHVDNAYFLEHVRVRSLRLRTHTVSNTAFRGFGGPQGMIAIERVMDAIAVRLALDPLDVRKANLYGPSPRNVTPYHQTVEDNIAPELIEALELRSQYRERRRAIAAYNAKSPVLKKGIALTPVKFGISFTLTHLNQAGALVNIHTDGSIALNHGGTEMGQGLMTKVAQVVAEELQVDVGRIVVTTTTTAKVPNTSATAASAGTDLNGMAAREAARTLKGRLIDYAARKFGYPKDQIIFRNDQVLVGNEVKSFQEIVRGAWMARISLSSTGFYATPKIGYDRKTRTGRPFFYFSYGAAVSEVVIDTLTGEMQVERVDILHDVGASLNPAIDLGQIEGGFIQGMGWLTTEELVFDDKGRLLTHAPSTYKIPACGDRPKIFNIELWDGQNREETVYRSKAVGEPPLMLALSVFSAIRDAVASTGKSGQQPQLDAPATPERILAAIDALKAS